jgi:hypothetical protein
MMQVALGSLERLERLAAEHTRLLSELRVAQHSHARAIFAMDRALTLASEKTRRYIRSPRSDAMNRVARTRKRVERAEKRLNALARALVFGERMR